MKEQNNLLEISQYIKIKCCKCNMEKEILNKDFGLCVGFICPYCLENNSLKQFKLNNGLITIHKKEGLKK